MSPQIELFGVAIAEPTTVATDYAIAVASAWFAARLFLSEHTRRYFACRAWAFGFLFTSLGFLLGGTGHGFAPYLGDGAMGIIWKLAYFAAGLSMASFVAGTVAGSVSATGWRKALYGLTALGVAAFTLLVAVSDDNFLLVIVVTVASLGFIALIQTRAFVTRKSMSAKWLIAGVLVYFLSAAIQQSGIDLHRHFNHNDLYHVVLMVGLYLLFRGAALLRDDERDDSPHLAR